MTFDDIFSKGLALTGAKEQAGLLDEFGATLFDICGGTGSRYENQCCYLARELNSNGRRLIKSLAGFVAAVEEREAEERKQ